MNHETERKENWKARKTKRLRDEVTRGLRDNFGIGRLEDWKER